VRPAGGRARGGQNLIKFTKSTLLIDLESGTSRPDGYNQTSLLRLSRDRSVLIESKEKSGYSRRWLRSCKDVLSTVAALRGSVTSHEPSPAKR
jgi:hypothetical protein